LFKMAMMGMRRTSLVAANLLVGKVHLAGGIAISQSFPAGPTSYCCPQVFAQEMGPAGCSSSLQGVRGE